MTTIHINNQPISLLESYIADSKKPTIDKKISTDISTKNAAPEEEDFSLTDSWVDIEKAVNTAMKNTLATAASISAEEKSSPSETWVEIDEETGKEIKFYDAEGSDSEVEDPSQDSPTIAQAGSTVREKSTLLTDSWVILNDEQTGKPISTAPVSVTQPKEPAKTEETFKIVEMQISEPKLSYRNTLLAAVGTFISPITNTATDLLSMLPSQDANKGTQPWEDHHTAAIQKLLSVHKKLENLSKSVFQACGLMLMPIEAGRTDSVQLSIGSRLSNYYFAFKGYASAVSNGTIGMTTGATISAAGIATVGLIGLAPAAVVVGTGALVCLYSLRSIPDAGKREEVIGIIDSGMPAIEKELAELKNMLAEETFRTKRLIPIAAEMAIHYKNYSTTQEIINAGRAELKNRESNVAESHNTRQSLEQAQHSPEKPTSESTKTLVSQILEYLRTRAESLANMFVDQTKKDRAEEALFKENNRTKLSDLVLSTTETTVTNDAYKLAHKNMNAGRKKSEHVILADLRKNIACGAVLVNDVMSSDLNFGVIEHRLVAGKENRGFALPSNLTTVRFITQYIDAQALSNPSHEHSAMRKMEDGSYVVADPDRKLYNFMTGAPNAHIKLIEQPASDSRLAMIMNDYSSNFPGGTNQMEFETQRDENGNTSLVLRFSKQEALADLTNERLSNHKTSHQTLTELMNETTPSSVDFSTMDTNEIQKYINSLEPVLNTQLALIQETQQQQTLLDNWKNPQFIQQA